MLDGAIIIPLQSLFWNLIFELAALLWIVDRALLNVGYFIMVLTNWVTQQAFAPLLGVIGEQTGALVGPLFSIAMLVLGFTYLMAVFGRFEVVSFRSAVMWLLIAAALYTFGPSLYLGMEDFRRLITGGFYEAGIESFNDASSASGLSAIGTMEGDDIPPPVDRFGIFLGTAPGASAVDGLDVAMAYVSADGYDVLAAAGSPHPVTRLPYAQVQSGADGFFDPDSGPAAFGSMPDTDRQASIGRAIQGVWRMFTVFFIILFGIIEQLINFLMACAFAIAFFSLFVAVLFGFFVRTEPIAWGALHLIIELFIQSLINGLLMSLILGFVMVGANTANAILLLGASLVGLWLSWNLLHSCIKGLTGSTERLYKGFGAVTGGSMVTVQESNKSLNASAISAATGASVLAGGGSFLQAMGATFGDGRTAQTMNYASRMLGGQDTLLGRSAEALGEGASARSLAGPLGGYLLGRQSQAGEQAERQRQTRLDYVGADDERRRQAVQAYRQSGDVADLEPAFGTQDLPRVRALVDSFEDDDFDTLADAVRRTRNDQAGISPQSPNFLGRLRADLPSPLRDLEAPALETFADLFGGAPEASPYQRSLARLSLPSEPNDAQSTALSRYRQGDKQALNDTFSPNDAQQLAQLMDSYDDDDFAQLVYAVRAAQVSQPNAPLGSPAHLQATQRFLPSTLQDVPDTDLSRLARAFALPAQASPSYLGRADRQRDAAVNRYLGTNQRQALYEDFPREQVNEVMILANEYERDDFDAVVQAVRQARTADPDMTPASPYAVRQARKNLPDHLRQMPTTDLTAFSRAFGAPADTPNVPASTTRSTPNTQASRRERFRLPVDTSELATPPAMQGLIRGSADSAPQLPPPSTEAGGQWRSLDELSAETPTPPPFAEAILPAPLAQAEERALGLDSPPPPLSLNNLPDISAPQRQLLTRLGLGTLDKLASAPLSLISQTAKVDETQAQSWRTSARAALRAQTETRQAQVQMGKPDLVQTTHADNSAELAPSPSTNTTSPVLTTTPISGIAGIGSARLGRLQAQGVNSLEALAQAKPAPVAQALRVSEAQVVSWQQAATQRLQSVSVATSDERALSAPSLPNVQANTPPIRPPVVAPSAYVPQSPPAPAPQTASNPTVPPAYVPQSPQAPIQPNPRQAQAAPTPQTTSNPTVPPAFVPQAPQAPVPAPTQPNPRQAQASPTPQAPIQPQASAPGAPPKQTNPVQTQAPTQPDSRQAQVEPAPPTSVPPAYVAQSTQATAPQAPTPPAPVNPRQAPVNPSIPPAYVPQSPQVPAPQSPPTQPNPSQTQAAPAPQTASNPTVPPAYVPQSPQAPAPQSPPVQAPNPRPSQPAPAPQTPIQQQASAPTVPPAYVPQSPQTPAPMQPNSTQAQATSAPQSPSNPTVPPAYVPQSPPAPQTPQSPQAPIQPNARQATSAPTVPPAYVPQSPQVPAPQTPPAPTRPNPRPSQPVPAPQTTSNPTVPPAYVPQSPPAPANPSQTQPAPAPQSPSNPTVPPAYVPQSPQAPAPQQPNPSVPPPYVPQSPPAPAPMPQSPSNPTVPPAYVPQSPQVPAPQTPQAPANPKQAQATPAQSSPKQMPPAPMRPNTEQAQATPAPQTPPAPSAPAPTVKPTSNDENPPPKPSAEGDV